MIRFKCIYCGQKVRTDDKNGGKKAKCPKCKSIIVIPAGGTVDTAVKSATRSCKHRKFPDRAWQYRIL